MEAVIDLIMNAKVFLIPIICFIGVWLIVTLIKKAVNKNRKNKEIRQAAADHLRDQNLNNLILNEQSRDISKEKINPYDVEYNSGNQQSVKGANKLHAAHSVTMIQLVEKTELSVRKFVLNPSPMIKIGSDLNDNDITVVDDSVAPTHCCIFELQNKVYIKTTGSGNQVLLKRRKDSVVVSDTAVRLLSKDIVIIGKNTYEIMVIN